MYNKHQIPSTEYQISSNEPNSKFQTPSPFRSPPGGERWGEGRSLEIGIWNLFGICNLEFGI